MLLLISTKKTATALNAAKLHKVIIFKSCTFHCIWKNTEFVLALYLWSVVDNNRSPLLLPTQIYYGKVILAHFMAKRQEFCV